MSDHVKTLSAFPFRVQLLEHSLVVVAKVHNVLPASKVSSCSLSHFCVPSERNNIILGGAA